MLQNKNSSSSSSSNNCNKDTKVTSSKSNISVNIELTLTNNISSTNNEDESDSNDSVFSTDGGSSSSGGSSANGDDPIVEPCFPNDEITSDYKRIELRDIYLGGSCLVRTRWRQDIAIPYLKTNGGTFYLPTLCEANYAENGTCKSQTDDIESRLMYNPAVLDSSRVLLFVITNDTRSLAPMTLAAHCIGLGYNVVLCVQMLPESCTIGHDLVNILIKMFSEESLLIFKKKNIYFISTVNTICCQGLQSWSFLFN